MSLYEYIKQKEGFRENQYTDAVGVPTIGYGRTTGDFGKTNRETENKWLQSRVDNDREYVKKWGAAKGYDWNDSQLDALTSGVFNMGRGYLDKVTKGGSRDNETIGNTIPLYHNAGGQPLAGLVTRRNEEAAMFQGSGGNSVPSNAQSRPVPTPTQPQQSFGDAFATARANHGGAGGTFDWQGQNYTTNFKEEDMNEYRNGTQGVPPMHYADGTGGAWWNPTTWFGGGQEEQVPTEFVPQAMPGQQVQGGFGYNPEQAVGMATIPPVYGETGDNSQDLYSNMDISSLEAIAAQGNTRAQDELAYRKQEADLQQPFNAQTNVNTALDNVGAPSFADQAAVPYSNTSPNSEYGEGYVPPPGPDTSLNNLVNNSQRDMVTGQTQTSPEGEYGGAFVPPVNAETQDIKGAQAGLIPPKYPNTGPAGSGVSINTRADAEAVLNNPFVYDDNQRMQAQMFLREANKPENVHAETAIAEVETKKNWLATAERQAAEIRASVSPGEQGYGEAMTAAEEKIAVAEAELAAAVTKKEELVGATSTPSTTSTTEEDKLGETILTPPEVEIGTNTGTGLTLDTATLPNGQKITQTEIDDANNKAPPEAKNQVSNMLQDFFGLDDQAVKQAVGMYFLSRLSGASHEGSMRWAGKKAFAGAAARKTQRATDIKSARESFKEDSWRYSKEARAAASKALASGDILGYHSALEGPEALSGKAKVGLGPDSKTVYVTPHGSLNPIAAQQGADGRIFVPDSKGNYLPVPLGYGQGKYSVSDNATKDPAKYTTAVNVLTENLLAGTNWFSNGFSDPKTGIENPPGIFDKYNEADLSGLLIGLSSKYGKDLTVDQSFTSGFSDAVRLMEESGVTKADPRAVAEMVLIGGDKVFSADKLATVDSKTNKVSGSLNGTQMLDLTKQINTSVNAINKAAGPEGTQISTDDLIRSVADNYNAEVQTWAYVKELPAVKNLSEAERKAVLSQPNSFYGLIKLKSLNQLKLAKKK